MIVQRWGILHVELRVELKFQICYVIYDSWQILKVGLLLSGMCTIQKHLHELLISSIRQSVLPLSNENEYPSLPETANQAYNDRPKSHRSESGDSNKPVLHLGLVL